MPDSVSCLDQYMLCTQQHKLEQSNTLMVIASYIATHDYIYLPTQFPDEFWNVPSLQVSAVHRPGAAPRRVSELLQVKQYAGLTGFEQVPQESSHTVCSG